MNNIITILLIFVSFNCFAQTPIPYAAMKGQITAVTATSSNTYDVTISNIADDSGVSNGSVVTTDNFVVWKNCKRYVITDAPTAFASTIQIELTDIDNAGAPSFGINTFIIEESPNFGIGHFGGGLPDGDQQCIASYYAEKMDNISASGGADGKVTDGDFDNSTRTATLSGTMGAGATFVVPHTNSSESELISAIDADGDGNNETTVDQAVAILANQQILPTEIRAFVSMSDAVTALGSGKFAKWAGGSLEGKKDDVFITQ